MQGEGVHWQSTKEQLCILLELQVNQWHASDRSVAYSVITQAVSLKSCDFFFVLVEQNSRYFVEDVIKI